MRNALDQKHYEKTLCLRKKNSFIILTIFLLFYGLTKDIRTLNGSNKMKKKVAIALQGGGSHGSFAWGVLDRFLEEDSIEIVAMSGTSAGGMNAACVINGLIEGGPLKAKERLKTYWHAVADLGKKLNPPTFGQFNLDALPFFHISKELQNILSPYDFNPLNMNPFLDFLKTFFDYSLLNEEKNLKLFLATTHVRSGKIKIFSNGELSAQTLMATACLPFLFQTVVIDGEEYWDGGYIANPAIYPLIDCCSNIIFLQLRRSRCDTPLRSRSEIADRLAEITFNGCVLREMRAIYFITHLIDSGKIPKDVGMERINLYLVKNEQAFEGLNMSSALNADIDFLTHLFEKGRQTAENWIKDNIAHLGEKTTFNPFDDFI